MAKKNEATVLSTLQDLLIFPDGFAGSATSSNSRGRWIKNRSRK